MDINIDPYGGFSLGFGSGAIIALLVIAMPVWCICWRIFKRRARPEKPKKLHIAIATVITTPIIYAMLIVLCYLAIKLLYLE
jgi:cytochrome c oxidase assembly factor CtaG